MNEDSYRRYFEDLTCFAPHDYQVEVARLLFDGRNVIVRAPTGAGKTWAVLAPFLYEGWEARPTRLIYALPLRTLAQGIYHEARDAALEMGLPVEAVVERDREIVSPFVTMQTGEEPEDPFFDRGKIIVTTYDQVLSGLLDGPYGLSNRLHNINAAAIAGALLIFDEFHLMPVQKAFLTAVAGLHLFRGLCQSVWMTATATKPLENQLRETLETALVPDSSQGKPRPFAELPSVRDVSRTLQVEKSSLTAEMVLRFPEGRSIALANTVSRAQNLYRDIAKALRERNSNTPVLLLHSRFFKSHRKEKEEQLEALFGPKTKGPAILVATQVIEAGIDISCDHLHTELCPMNSLVQRAGRCARFPSEIGTVHVYNLPDEPRSWLPYGDLTEKSTALRDTAALLLSIGSATMNPEITADWVNRVHAADDEQELNVVGCIAREIEIVARIGLKAIQRNNQVGIADLIRGSDSESIAVIIARDEHLPAAPAKREAVSLRRWSLARLLNGGNDVGWFWDSGADEPTWKPIRGRDELRNTYAICFRPEFAEYTKEIGFVAGIPGGEESPDREPPKRPGYAPLHAESWVHHAVCVAKEASLRMQRDCPPDGFLNTALSRRYGLNSSALSEAARACALLHDLGKLQAQWQRWAEAAMDDKKNPTACERPLAHTDFDPNKNEDREGEREVSKRVRRPPPLAVEP